MEKTMEAPVIPRTVSHYTVLRKLGAGGMGEVYLAEDAVLHRRVAIKFLPHDSVADDRARRRLIREAQAAARLDHSNICTIHEVGEEAGRGFIVMEFVDGETLASRFRHKPLDLSECLDIAVQVADALAEAHSQGITHRDIKPQNIMLTAHHQAKVIDFGLAKVIRDRSLVNSEVVTESLSIDTGVIVGTITYMSPEQVSGKNLDARTDIFSFGAVLYEMVTGHQAFAGDSTATIISAIISKEPVPLTRYLSDVPPELERIVTKALQKDRDARYQTTRDLLIDLQRLKHHLELAEEFGRSFPPETNDVGRHARMIAANEPADPRGLAPRVTKSCDAIEDELTITPGGINSPTVDTSILQRPSSKLVISGVLVALAVALIYFAFGGSPKPDAAASRPKKIAILPFRSLSANDDDEYLGLGMSDTLITRLSNVRQIIVRPTSAVRKYAGREFDPLAAGREQQVDVVLEGSVERAGDRLRVTVRLINVQDERPVWGKTFNEEFTDILTVQDQIAERLTDALAVNLTGEEKRGLAKQYTLNTEAYKLYLKARYFWNKRTTEDLKKSIDYLSEAIKKDPLFALAYAGLADSYSLLADYDELPVEETYPQARTAVTKALQIDGELAEARTSLAYIKAFFEWDWVGAESEFKRAIELNPNYATAHQWYAEYLSATGRTEEALAEIKKAEELDPVSLIISAVEAWILYFAHDYDGAIAKCLKVNEMDPNFAEAYEYLKRSYDQKGMYKQAIAARQTRRKILGLDAQETAALRVAASTTNSRVYWQKRLEQEIEESKKERVSPVEMAEILAQLGEKDRALDWLEKAHAERNLMITYVKVAPNLDPLRSDARFSDLLRRIGLPQ